MKKICFVMFLLFILTACAKQSLNLANISNVHSAQLHATPSQSIVVISDHQEGQLWYKLDENHQLKGLALFTGTSFQPVDQIAISPDDQWIAVITVGEGHPLIAVYDLQSALHGDDDDYNREERKGFTALFIDPYPGYIEIVGWKGKQLIVISDVALDHLDKKERRVLNKAYESPVEKTFIWHVPTDSITQQ
ncbi:MAG: hypothetical protein Q9M28_01875 [Mariprofundaceae bacterium]|nr:hypothetical protein [Mariprofundaceae bacterium]